MLLYQSETELAQVSFDSLAKTMYTWRQHPRDLFETCFGAGYAITGFSRVANEKK
jgi:predicted GNAT superfamily acetyltransferase